MLPSPLDSVTSKYLEDLCNSRTPETQTLEFKSELPGRDSKARNDFLKDVSAIANAQGGDLIYGVQEEDGCAITLIPITGESLDEAKRRLGQILDAGIEPRIIGLQFKDVPVAGGYILLLRVHPEAVFLAGEREQASDKSGPRRGFNGAERWLLITDNADTDAAHAGYPRAIAAKTCAAAVLVISFLGTEKPPAFYVPIACEDSSNQVTLPGVEAATTPILREPSNKTRQSPNACALCPVSFF